MNRTVPNVLLIIIDDLGWVDLSCQGSTFYETPRIDSIARDGVRFTRAYASCPVCSPTRASIMTGKYPARVGITQWIGGHNRGRVIDAPYLHYLPLEEKTVAKAFKERGYKTYHVGKWHLGDEPYWPEHHGFDVNVGGCHWGSPWHGYFSPWGIPTLPDGPRGEYLTDRLTDEAIRLLESNGDAPFFMYWSHYAVHRPIQSPKPLVEKYRAKAAASGLDRQPAFVPGKSMFHLEGQASRRIPERVVQSDPDYAAMIENLDTNVGRVLDALDRLGIAGNTIVIFYSDNGGLSNDDRAPTSNAPLRDGKSYMYEGGIREPLLIKWPGVIRPGSVCTGQVTSTDFYPTLLDCCGVPREPGQHVDGKSFFALLQEPGLAWDRGPIYWHYPHYNGNGARPASSVIDGAWKLIEWLEDGKVELFNIDDDVGEQHDLARDQPAVRDCMLGSLKGWQRETRARMPQPNPNYPGYLARDFVGKEGVLVLVEGEGACIKAQLTPDNPEVVEIPVADLVEDFLERTVKLVIDGETMVGRLYIDANEALSFADTFTEQNAPLERLLKPLAGHDVRVSAWSDIDPRLLDEDELEGLRRRGPDPVVEVAVKRVLPP
ncbi:MAG: sulfatase [Candidatus Lokiarchaeota archaeon]|nr:sulfatase [Candidatus Lokiarchaeota archaeon]